MSVYERKREREMHTYIYIYIYTYVVFAHEVFCVPAVYLLSSSGDGGV